MGIMNKRWLTALSLIFVLSVATACFQQVGDEAGGQAVSVVIASDTPIPLPTDTATQFVAQDVPISNNPTETDTPTPTDTSTPTDTPTPLEVAQAGGTATPDDFSLRATQLVIDATNTAVAPLTQTAAVIIGFTDTPTATTAPVDTGTTVIVSGADCVHEVRAGETMYSYSRYYGIPVMDIATRNNVVNPNIISVGQRLIIPGCGTTGALPPATSTPTPTLTPYALTGTGGTNLAGDANPGQGGGLVTTSCVAQYTVQQYDTLFQISISYGVSVQSIANANGIINTGRINMGDVLCIPSS